MPNHDAWQAIERECPRRIIHELHENGEYHHGHAARYPGKVLCLHKDDPLPAGWTPTPAQERAWHRDSQSAAPPPAPQEAVLGVGGAAAV